MERTHEVVNQPPPLEGYPLYTSDVALREGVEREAGGGFAAELERAGQGGLERGSVDRCVHGGGLSPSSGRG